MNVYDQNAIVFVKEGKPIDDCYLRICDDQNQILEDGMVGHIQIKGKNVTSGYYNDPKSTTEFITADGWLKTSDLGFLTGGELVVTGRAKDIITVGGRYYYPHDIERVVEEVEGVELGKVAACGVINPDTALEEIVVFLQYRKKVEDFIPYVIQVKRQINHRIGLIATEVIPVRDLPKTTSGKIQRYKLVKQYQIQEFQETLTEIHQLLEGILTNEPEAEAGNVLVAI